jgi:hypothetical protein
MRAETRDLLDRFESLKWFAYVGGNGAISSWAEATDHIERQDWLDVRVAASNALVTEIAAASPERMRRWNDIASLVRELLDELLDTALPREVRGVTLSPSIRTQVEWDLGQVVMASEYVDVARSPFFEALRDSYLAGRLPCGWSGALTAGSLVEF